MACGAPCVLSDLPWVHEQIGDGREALIVPVSQAPSPPALRRVLVDDEFASGLARRARALVERRHDGAAQMDRLAEAYRSLL